MIKILTTPFKSRRPQREKGADSLTLPSADYARRHAAEGQ